MRKYFYNLANGRINRITFWVGMGITFAIFIVENALAAPFYQFLNNIPMPWYWVVPFAHVLIFYILFFSIIFRRLHDADSDLKILTAHNWAAYGLPFTFNILLIFKKGNPGENKWGKPPSLGIDLKGLIGL